ncbi:MAG: winged helix-turn-helix domain-containing protein [Gemmatimonadaceae bacterium]|nr:winged helix-turn-helix domain-containing protein [Gemmatimonadaceae bacterium]
MQPPGAHGPRVTFFGGASIQVDGVPIGGRSTHRHPLALLALLAVNRGRPLTRDKLIALLWPERDAESARNLLKVAVHELRKELGDDAIRTTGDQLSANLAALSCDISDFHAALDRGDDRAAAEGYAGPLLDGFFLKEAADFERWADDERVRLGTLYAGAVERLAESAERDGDTDAAVRWRRAHAAHDPYLPEVAERLIRALVAAGDRAGAIRFAESFAARRRADLEITDDHDLVALARGLESGYATASPVRETDTDAHGASVLGAPVHHATVPGAVRAAHDSTETPRRGWRHARWFAVGVPVVALVAVAFAAVAAVAALRARVSADGRVVVAPFRVVGGDSSLGDALATLLSTRLAGDDVSDAGAARRVEGEIAGAADSVVVTARMYATGDSVPLASARVDAAAGAAPARIADRLAIELMARAAGEADDHVAMLLARAVEPARTFIAAQHAYRAARYARAESLYVRALDADSTFAAAGLGLALANSWTGISDNYGRGRDVAMRHLDALSPRDRAFASAFFGPDPALGPPRPAPVHLAAWEDVVERWPDWPDAWYQLGDRYFHYGGVSGLPDAGDRARLAFRRALQPDPRFVAPLHHLVELYAARRERAELRVAGDRYFAANPRVARDSSAIGWEMAMALDDAAWLARVHAALDAMPREDLARIAWITDANGWSRGDAERASAILERRASVTSERERALMVEFALRLNGAQNAEARQATARLGALFPGRPVAALWDLFAALFGDGDAALAASAASHLTSFVRGAAPSDHVARDQHHLASCLSGYWSASRGDLATARAAQSHLRSALRAEDNNFARRNGEVCLAMLSASIAVRSRASEAPMLVARLDTLLLRERVPPHAILEAATISAARLHATLGDTAAALVAARRREHFTGEPFFLATELREEAIYARAVGDVGGAARATAHLKALRER